MRFPTLCSMSAVLLLGSAGSTFASETAAPAGPGDTFGSSVAGFAPESWVPCKPAAAQSIFAIEDAAAKGAITSDPASKPCTLRIADASPVNPVGRSPVAATDQTAAGTPAAATAESELSEVVVTGTRIARPDFVSDQPIVTLSAAELEESAKVNVEAALEQSPQFVNGQDENYNSNGINGGRATLNLRGLGQQRTLVLLDGRRLSPTDGTGVADLNEVPQGIVDSIQVITGGASAAYGSDAMAGVVNIITKNLDGLEIGASHGAASCGCGQHEDFYVNAGSSFADGKGHAMLSLEYTERDAVMGNQIPFFFFGGQGVNIPYGSYVPTIAPPGLAVDLPSQAAVNTYFAKYGAPAGAVSNTLALGFNGNGTLNDLRTPFYNYQGIGPGGRSGVLNVNGALVFAVGQYDTVISPSTRDTAFAKVTYDITDNTHLYLQVLATYDEVSTQDVYQQINANSLTTIPVTNPFIPSDLAGLLASRPNPTEPFAFSKRLLDFPPQLWHEYFDTDQFIWGANGKIPGVNFDWDIYYSHDYSLDLETDNGVFSQYRVETLLDAPDGGNSICAGGFNPFQGYHSYVSPQCAAYLEVTTHASTIEYQDTVEGNLGGKIVDLPAGEAKFDLTGDWRQWASSYTPDDLNVLGNPPSTTVNGTNPTSGQITLKEIAGEVLIPVLKDKPFAKAWNLNLGYRESDYNISGRTDAYKLNTDWRPVQSLLLRGGYEHAIRAPDINDLFQAPTTASVQVGNTPSGGDPCDARSSVRNGPNAAQIAALCVAQGIPQSQIATYEYSTNSAPSLSSGSLLVKPEIGNTLTLGAVLTPDFSRPAFAHMQLSLDYYHIRIADAIGSSGYQYVLENCYNENGANPTYSATNPYCEEINRNFGGVPGGSFQILQPASNLGGVLNSGIDAELDWNWHLTDLGLGAGAGQLHLNSTVSWTQHYMVQVLPGTAWIDYTATIPLPLSPTPPAPVWHSLTTLTYSVQPVPVSVGLRWRYIDAMHDVSYALNPATTIAGVPAYNYLDFVASWKITDHIDLSGTLTNLTGKNPPVISASPGFTQPELYDITKLTYLVTLHAKF